MIRGIDHITICVSNMEKALHFYQEILGFKKVIFDYSGNLTGMDKIVGKSNVKARIMLLKTENIGPLGQGLIKLVQFLPPFRAKPINVEHVWSDIGISEVALNVINMEKILAKMKDNNIEIVLPPQHDTFDNKEVIYAYIRDPDGSLVELVEWVKCKDFLGGGTRIEGVNHISIGVNDMEKSLRFYRDIFGFQEVFLDSTGLVILPPALKREGTPDSLNLRLVMLANNYCNGWLEMAQHIPPYKPKYKLVYPEWAHIGHMEFSIGVSNIAKTYEESRKKNVKFLCPPKTVNFPSLGEWKFAYVIDPDGLLVSLVEY
jgi:catechol 2,3-dioxygenase-like lactoylglutathione lyase family enzyme